VTKGGSIRLFETRYVDRDFYDKIKRDLRVVFGGDACTDWPEWQEGKHHRYHEVEWHK